jgi:hypothetical protein
LAKAGDDANSKESTGGWPTLNDRSILSLIFRVAHPSDFVSGKGGAFESFASFASSFYLDFRVHDGGVKKLPNMLT